MLRSWFFGLTVIGLLAGAAEQIEPPAPPQKPNPAPEMAKLQRFIGSWAGKGEMVEPSAEQMKKTMPEGAPEMPSSFQGANKGEWALGGMFLKGDGWYEMGPGQKAHYVEYWTWDPTKKKYRTWYANDWGEHGQAWAWFEADGNTMRMEGEAVDAAGNAKRGEGTITFTDDNTMEWTWSETGPLGMMKMKGTSKRQ